MLSLKTKENEIEFQIILSDILQNKTVLQMKDYFQHYETDCYEHCYNVAIITYNMCKFFNLEYIPATRAAMLHDLFLYDWRIKSEVNSGLHGFKHPAIALSIASKEFNLTSKEQDIILKHMWPLTITPPKSLEGFCVTLADKFAVLYESFIHYKKSLIFKYHYMFFSMLIFRIL